MLGKRVNGKRGLGFHQTTRPKESNRIRKYLTYDGGGPTKTRTNFDDDGGKDPFWKLSDRVRIPDTNHGHKTEIEKIH